MRKSKHLDQAIMLPFILSFVLTFTDCHHSTRELNHQPPVSTRDGLNVGTLEDANMDAVIMGKAVQTIKSGKFKEIHSMLIYKDDKLVFEQYFPGHIYQWDAPGYHGELVQWHSDRIHRTMSCTKSFTSACIGIAVERGYIDHVHQSIFDHLPDHQHFKNNGKENITIEHLLTMTAGLAWNEWNAPHGTSANDIDRLYFECSDDPVKCVLERELLSTPGEDFTYSGGGMVILGEILRNAAGMNIDAFSMKYLFGPLGIDSTLWFQYANGAIATDGSLQLTPRDMLKFGVTYLNRGLWNGERILPDEWVEKSSKIYHQNKGIKIPIEDSGKNGYGYSWWISEFSHRAKKVGMYRAGGWGGQAIMVFPDLNMVVVFTGGNYASKSSLYKIIRRYVLPAIK
jgi:CubicO group peptidase (beta-lactamase class C family)